MQVRIGDWISFKNDIEQSGQIIAVKRDLMNRRLFILENKNGFQGAYIGGKEVVQVLEQDCWIE